MSTDTPVTFSSGHLPLKSVAELDVDFADPTKPIVPKSPWDIALDHCSEGFLPEFANNSFSKVMVGVFRFGNCVVEAVFGHIAHELCVLTALLFAQPIRSQMLVVQRHEQTASRHHLLVGTCFSLGRQRQRSPCLRTIERTFCRPKNGIAIEVASKQRSLKYSVRTISTTYRDYCGANTLRLIVLRAWTSPMPHLSLNISGVTLVCLLSERRRCVAQIHPSRLLEL